MGFADVEGAEVEDRRFFGDGARVGQDCKGVDLESVVVGKAEGFHPLNEGVKGSYTVFLGV